MSESDAINVKPIRLDWIDVQDLAAHVVGLDPDDYEDSEIEELLADKFFQMEDGALGAFHKIVEYLIPATDVGESPLSGTYYRGFTRDFGRGKKNWLVKHKIEMPRGS